jgi:hypothetical protein
MVLQYCFAELVGDPIVVGVITMQLQFITFKDI